MRSIVSGLFGAMARLALWLLLNLFQRICGHVLWKRLLPHGWSKPAHSEAQRKPSHEIRILVDGKDLSDNFLASLFPPLRFAQVGQVCSRFDVDVLPTLGVFWLLFLLEAARQNGFEASEARDEEGKLKSFELFWGLRYRKINAKHKLAIHGPA